MAGAPPGDPGDLSEAAEAVDRLAAAPSDSGLKSREINLLRLRALLARAWGDRVRFRDLRDRYRDLATSLGFEGHIAWAKALKPPRDRYR
ncbi:hypothetical protein LAUMK35_03559 [Mycobacterium pseudokansasii]|uniref:Uncharacterized protein n=1 Tax=Mycobacterium pseudokansasii TaxID=2341080 RepID=A0A498QTI8_9MYCO|nr:hypothetical protein LAUMK35_03559 [Mycobacterium pseudokansasii]VAZ98515.1 hypothetical protein LAUMK21_03556 [Mycobacterium pseudokansasii]VBA52215.1 hypothetical protein LAUMK142_03448 [Mycobacterium pseudokansasii]